MVVDKFHRKHCSSLWHVTADLGAYLRNGVGPTTTCRRLLANLAAADMLYVAHRAVCSKFAVAALQNRAVVIGTIDSRGVRATNKSRLRRWQCIRF